MARIGKSFTFEAAHRLQNHNGKCFNLHGHSYRVEIAITGEIQEDSLATPDDRNPAQGMVLDFGRLNEWWKPIEAAFDHKTILDNADPWASQLREIGVEVAEFHLPPTAENIAAWILEDLQTWLLNEIWPGQIFTTPTVRVYETAKSWAEG